MAALVEAIPIVNLHPVTVLHLPRQDLVTDSVGVYLGPAALAYNDRFPDPLMAKIGFRTGSRSPSRTMVQRAAPCFCWPTRRRPWRPTTSSNSKTRCHSFFSPDGIYIKRSGVLLAVFQGTESRAQAVLERFNGRRR